MWGQQMSCEQNRYQDKITSGVWSIKKKKKKWTEELESCWGGGGFKTFSPYVESFLNLYFNGFKKCSSRSTADNRSSPKNRKAQTKAFSIISLPFVSQGNNAIKQRDEQLLVYSSPGADCQMALLDFFIIDFLRYFVTTLTLKGDWWATLNSGKVTRCWCREIFLWT